VPPSDSAEAFASALRASASESAGRPRRRFLLHTLQYVILLLLSCALGAEYISTMNAPPMQAPVSEPEDERFLRDKAIRWARNEIMHQYIEPVEPRTLFHGELKRSLDAPKHTPRSLSGPAGSRATQA